MSTKTSVQVRADLALAPAEAFETCVAELVSALERLGMELSPGPGGLLVEEGAEVGRVITWEPGRRVELHWRPAPWEPDEITTVELSVEPIEAGARVTLEQRGWGRPLGEPAEVAGWFASEVAAPLLRATSPAALADWLTDRHARRPTGALSRATYRDPLFHYPGFRVLLEELVLTANDHLLEVACGGGALLKQALESGCSAAAVDHSNEMVRLAQEENAAAIAAGRLEIREAPADQLPFADESFTCAVMAGALGFLPDPVAALAEIRRVLRPGGRLVAQGSDPRMRGTPAAPEPMASRLRYWDDAGHSELAVAAGFDDARVIRRSLEAFAREVGIPEEYLSLYGGEGSPFLLARKR